MKANIITAWAARLSGALLILSVIPHFFFAFPARVLVPVADGRVPVDLGQTYYAIWAFASMTLLFTGVMMIYISGGLRRLERKAWWMALLISGGLTYYGSYVVIKFNETTHNTSFIVFGLITLVPLLVFFRSFSKQKDDLS
jgi:hypothetical protein